MLENVKNPLSHDNGETFEIIRNTLENVCGYTVNWGVVDGSKWVPQHSERVLIIGYDLKQIPINKKDIIILYKPDENYKYPKLSTIIEKKLDGHTIGLGTWATLERYKAHHASKGNGFGYGLHRFEFGDNAVTRTISSRYYKDGAEILIVQEINRPRRL